MERIVLLIIGLIAVVAFVVIIELKFPNSPLIKAFSRALGALAAIAAIVQVLPIDLDDWLRPPDEPAIVVPGIVPGIATGGPPAGSTEYPPTATATPTTFAPRPTGALLYQKDLRRAADSPEWGVADDDAGHSGYDGLGYTVAAPRGQRSHFVLNRQNEYTNFVMEVDVTPLSDENLPAILLVVGWREDGPVYLFVLPPDGQCGRSIVAEEEWRQVAKDQLCPALQADHTLRVRLEVSERFMRAFINGQPIKEYPLDGYSSGAIGLGVLNYAPPESDDEAEARFHNLMLWALP